MKLKGRIKSEFTYNLFIRKNTALWKQISYTVVVLLWKWFSTYVLYIFDNAYSTQLCTITAKFPFWCNTGNSINRVMLQNRHASVYCVEMHFSCNTDPEDNLGNNNTFAVVTPSHQPLCIQCVAGRKPCGADSIQWRQSQIGSYSPCFRFPVSFAFPLLGGFSPL